MITYAGADITQIKFGYDLVGTGTLNVYPFLPSPTPPDKYVLLHITI